ncbi:hypothetical protein KN1_11300 [Stygiolobus caldivivus]|uniref:Uncharacterized protein n=1 Tax=Stygiolobus caldivivus TaxID=2824673 RepID=A0A8D5U6C7_9CREN|nr:hypothetical protein KN1_11300 [Stygiolobus caldivivus]
MFFPRVVLERIVFMNTAIFLQLLIEFDDCLRTLPLYNALNSPQHLSLFVRSVIACAPS